MVTDYVSNFVDLTKQIVMIVLIIIPVLNN